MVFVPLLFSSCKKDRGLAPSIVWISPEKDLTLKNTGSLKVEVQVSDNNDEINATLSLSDQSGNVFYSTAKFSNNDEIISFNENISTINLAEGEYRISVLAEDHDGNRIRSSINLNFYNDSATTANEGLVSLHRAGTQAYLNFYVNGGINKTVSFQSVSPRMCTDPLSGYTLVVPEGAGDARCYDPLTAEELWTWPGTSGTLGGFSACTATNSFFLIGEKSGYVRKFSISGSAQGSYSYAPGVYYPYKIFVHDNLMYVIQKPQNSGNPDKIVVFNFSTGFSLQELNLNFRAEDATSSNDSIYIISQNNPRQIWRYSGQFNSLELIDQTGINSSFAYLSKVQSTSLLLTAEQGIYEIKPASSWTNLLYNETGIKTASRLSPNPNNILYLKNNSLFTLSRSSLSIIGELEMEPDAIDFGVIY